MKSYSFKLAPGKLLPVILVLLSFSISAQNCLNTQYCNNPTNQYPSTIQSLSANNSWEIVMTASGLYNACFDGGNWTVYNVEQGYTYQWTTCSAISGQTLGQHFDAKLTLKDINDNNLCRSSSSGVGACPNSPYLSWQATFSGQVKVLISDEASSSCGTTSGTCSNVGGTYTWLGWSRSGSPTGELSVNLYPSGAVSAGAQWRVDNGAWQNSSSTVSNLSEGTHVVNFSAISGWSTPSDQYPSISANQTTTTSGTYSQIQQYGSLQVTINPSGAVSAGAQWRVDLGRTAEQP